MDVRELAVPGAWHVAPTLHTDRRGTVFEWFVPDALREATGRAPVPAQANCSVSARGALRGIHFAQLPPGQAKYVTCVRGAVFDVVVDIRVGSPTFGGWDAVVLDDRTRASVFLAEGLGHAFMALEEDTTVMYLVSSPYTPSREHAVSALDPAIGVDWPSLPPVLSPRDLAAPSLAHAAAEGLLPSWEETRDAADALRAGARAR